MNNSSVEYIGLRKKILRKLWRMIKAILKYPFDIKNRYAYHNAILTQMMKNIKKNKPEELDKLRTKNVHIVNVAIFLPLMLGIFANCLYFYSESKVQQRYSNYVRRVSLPVGGEGFFGKTKKVTMRGVAMVVNQPVSVTDFNFFFYGYAASILGALFLSANPAFRRAEEIEAVLLKMNKVDGEKHPWRVLWTPNYLFFEAYGCDPHAFVNDVKFWNTINYPPAEPIIFDDQMTKFIVPKKYQLPSKIEFKYKEVHV